MIKKKLTSSKDNLKNRNYKVDTITVDDDHHHHHNNNNNNNNNLMRESPVEFKF